jgi:hypothetical protein
MPPSKKMAGEVALAGHQFVIDNELMGTMAYGVTFSVWLQDASICFTTASGNGT